jgi:gluconokinase
VDKMKNGIPLTDEDREPWLRSMKAAIEQWKRDEAGHVLACSALKASYREMLGQNDPDVKFVYLEGGFDLICQRLKERKSHFFNPALLRSQFDALEPPKGALVVDVSKEPQEIVGVIQSALKSAGPRAKKNQSKGGLPPNRRKFPVRPGRS